MPRYSTDGNILAYWVLSIASQAAPTVAELNAGTRLSGFLTKDGLDIPFTQNNVDNADLEDSFDAKGIGTDGADINLTFFRNLGTDTAWNLFTRGLTGFLVVRRGIAVATGWVAGQKCEVYPGECHRAVPLTPAQNERDKAKVMIAVTDSPSLSATVAA